MTAGGRRVQLRDQGNGLFAYGMNNKGAVVGQDLTPSGWLPFVWEPGKGVYTLVGGQGAGLAINDAGWVTGEMDAVGLSHAFVAQPGAPMQDIQTLDVAGSQGEDINAFGNVAGTATVLGDYTQRAFVYTQGTGMQLLPLPAGATASWGQALNDSGAVIGTFKVGFDMHAFLWNGSTMLDLGTLPGDAAASFPVDINNSGWVVGYSYLADDSAVQGWRWTPQDGMVSLASLLPAAQQNCRIYGPSNIDSHGDIPVLADCGSGYFIGLMTPPADFAAPQRRCSTTGNSAQERGCGTAA